MGSRCRACNRELIAYRGKCIICGARVRLFERPSKVAYRRRKALKLAENSLVAELAAARQQQEAQEALYQPSGVHWREMERRACQWMQANGFRDARLTGRGVDGGLDIVAKSAVAQVKHQRATTGGPAVQQLVGAAEGRRALLFSSTGFSKKAVEFANRYSVALFQQVVLTDGTATVEPLNTNAQSLCVAVVKQSRTDARIHRRDAEMANRDAVAAKREAAAVKRDAAAEKRAAKEKVYAEQHPDSWVTRMNARTAATRDRNNAKRDARLKRGATQRTDDTGGAS